MNVFVRRWRRFANGRKFARLGKHCSFNGRFLQVDGHIELGDRCKIRNHVIMRTTGQGKILIDTYSGISFYCCLEATKLIKIGRFTGIAEFTVIRDTNHAVIGTDEHWRLTPYIAEPIVIGDACMISSGCYIGPGVAIGDGAVVGPRSVVTKDIGPYEIWTGNPARKIGHRVEGVSQSVRQRYVELLNTYGLRENRHGYDQEVEAIKQAAVTGVNKAAEERDRLKKAFDEAAQAAAVNTEEGSGFGGD